MTVYGADRHVRRPAPPWAKRWRADRCAHALLRLCPGLPRLRRDHHLRAGHFGVADEAHGRELPDAAQAALERRGEDELVARLDRLAEARLVDADEIEARVLVGHHVRGEEREDARGLRERLDDHDARHHGPVREMPGEERLVERDVLDGANALALRAFEHAVDEQERIAMRQLPHDAHDVE